MSDATSRDFGDDGAPMRFSPADVNGNGTVAGAARGAVKAFMAPEGCGVPIGATLDPQALVAAKARETALAIQRQQQLQLQQQQQQAAEAQRRAAAQQMAMVAARAVTGQSTAVPVASPYGSPQHHHQQQQQQQTPGGSVTAVAAPATGMRALSSAEGQELIEKEKAEQSLMQGRRLVPFTIVRELTLNELNAGSEKPSWKIAVDMSSLPESQRNGRHVVHDIKMTHRECSSALPMGVLFSDFKPRARLSLPNGKITRPYHAKLPRGSQGIQSDVCSVYTNDAMVDPAKVFKYGNVKNIEQVRAQLFPVEHMGYVHAPFDSLIGSMLVSNDNRSMHVHTMVEVNPEQRAFIKLPKGLCDKLLERIDTEVLQDEQFQTSLRDLNNMDVTLVPLNTSGQWDDVPEIRSHDALARELDRRFSVHIEGEIELTAMPST